MVDLFVYGSLKRGGRHHALLRQAEFVAETLTTPGYYLVALGEYLALVAGGELQVPGEHYRLPSSLLAELDSFEGAEYERRSLSLASGVTAQAYFARARGGVRAP